MKVSRFAVIGLCGAIAVALQTPSNAVVKKHPPVHTTKGVSQMPGGYGAFGVTYTLSEDGPLLNYTITKAEYTIQPYNFTGGNNALYTFPSDVLHKTLVLHFRVKNATNSDVYYSGGHVFQVIDADGNTLSDSGYVNRESTKQRVLGTLKPGQGYDDLEESITVPAHGAVGKLILQDPMPGTNYKVLRFNLGKAPNTVAPLPAPYVDPSDPSGATALDKIKGTIGTPYCAGKANMSLDAVSLSPGPLGYSADSGKQFLVATVTVTNLALQDYGYNDDVQTMVITDEGRITDHQYIKKNSNDEFAGADLFTGDSATKRILIQVPTDAQLKTLALTYNMGNDGLSREFDYDLSSLNKSN